MDWGVDAGDETSDPELMLLLPLPLLLVFVVSFRIVLSIDIDIQKVCVPGFSRRRSLGSAERAPER
jgi:hypothetical protein